MFVGCSKCFLHMKAGLLQKQSDKRVQFFEKGKIRIQGPWKQAKTSQPINVCRYLYLFVFGCSSLFHAFLMGLEKKPWVYPHVSVGHPSSQYMSITFFLYFHETHWNTISLFAENNPMPIKKIQLGIGPLDFKGLQPPDISRSQLVSG